MPSLNPNCRDCELWKTAGNVCVAGDGPKDAQIIVIGEAPGAAEAKHGRPFMGESGKILREELSKNGIINDTYITNVVKCRPPENRTPTPAEIRACRKYLDRELAEINPRFVATLGATATKTLFRGVAKISEMHGKLIEDPKLSYVGMPAFHPAYTLRDPSKLPSFQNDIARLARASKGKERKATVNWSVVRRGTLEQFLREFADADEFAFDLETTGLFPFDGKGHITCVAIALPWRTWVIPNFMPHAFLSRGNAFVLLMQLLFEMQGVKIAYAQNGKFDNAWLQVYCGGKFRLDFDTMLASHTLDENREHDLKTMVRMYLDEPEYDIATKFKVAWILKEGETPKLVVRPGELYKYNAYDATYTLRLGRLFRSQLDESDNRPLRRLFYRLVMPAARLLERAEYEGFHVDLDKMDEVGMDLLTERSELEEELDQVAGKEVNWNSPQQVSKVLYDDLGIKSGTKTKGGSRSTSEEALLDLKGRHEAVDLLLKYREVAKQLSTYIIGLREFMVGPKLHISHKIHGTVTGRYSSRLHSIPRDGKIRNLVNAPEGWSFVQADISQAELRIIASVAEELEMMRCFKENIDIHWRTLLSILEMNDIGDYTRQALKTAQAIDGHRLDLSTALRLLAEVGHERATEIWPGWKDARKRAKAINFGYVYGMYEKKFILTARTKYGWWPTFDEAHMVREAYFTLYPGLTLWHNKMKRLAHVNNYVRMLSGRLRRLPTISAKDRTVRSEAERQAINSPIQGFIGDYKAMCMVEIGEKIDWDLLRVLGEHHDAILMMARTKELERVLPTVLSIIRKPQRLKEFKINLHVPMEGEIEVGPWGAGKKWKVDEAKRLV